MGVYQNNRLAKGAHAVPHHNQKKKKGEIKK